MDIVFRPAPAFTTTFKRCAAAVAVACAAFGAASVHAVPVTGDLHIDGGLSLSLAGIDFTPPSAGGVGVFMVEPGSTGTFAPLVGTSGLVKDVGPPPASIVTNDLLRFVAAPGLHFDSTMIFPGAFSPADCFAPPAAGQVCSPPGLDVNFVNVTADMSVLTIAGQGNFVSADGDSTPYYAILTTQFASMSFQEVIATLQAGGEIASSWSASLTPVPEPATVALTVAGLLVMGGVARRRARTR